MLTAEILPPVVPATRPVQFSTGDVSVVLEHLLSIDQVLEIVPLARSTLYKEMAAGRFPRPMRIAGRRVAWGAADIASWMGGLSPAVAAA